MAINLGKIRFWILKRAGGLFCWLEKSNDGFFKRQMFKVCRWVWEAISPSKVYRIVSLSAYSSNHDAVCFPIKSNRMGYAANAACIGRKDKQMLYEAPLPNLNLYCLKGICVHHGSDFLANKDEGVIINDYCALKNDDNKGYEDQWSYWQKGKITIVRRAEEIKHLKSGIMMLDKYSFNYYHNMYDNLIRLCVLEECNQLILKDVPIIIDEEIIKVPSFKRIFDILTEKSTRPIIVVKFGQQYYVERLYYLTNVNHIVPLHIDYTKGKNDDYVFDKEYILKLRSMLLRYRDLTINTPKRIFITRKNTTKRRFNEIELFEELSPYGFKMIAPEEYSFEEQMSLFSGAEIIIGGSGAAFTNLLFASPGCKIICLFWNTDYNPPVFSAPVCFNGAQLTYFMSKKRTAIQSAHTDFTIEVEDFKDYMRNIMSSSI